MEGGCGAVSYTHLITMQDDGQPLPESSELDAVECTQGEIASLVDVDFDAYRREMCIRDRR